MQYNILTHYNIHTLICPVVFSNYLRILSEAEVVFVLGWGLWKESGKKFVFSNKHIPKNNFIVLTMVLFLREVSKIWR